MIQINSSRAQLFFALFTIGVLVFLATPLILLSGNQFNFNIMPKTFFSISTITIFFYSVAAVIITNYTPQNHIRHITLIFLYFMCIIFLQQNILVWDYGYLQGSEIDWGVNTKQTYIELIVWVGIALFFILKNNYVYRLSTSIILFVGITSTLIIFSYGYSLLFSNDKKIEHGQIDEIDKFTFSTNRSVIYFLLDGFQSDIFNYLLDENPHLREDLSGFVYYSDTASVFAKTYPSVPMLLTGHIYKKEKPLIRFIEDSFLDDSLTMRMIKEGWDVGLYPLVEKSMVVSPEVATNFVKKGYNRDGAADYSKLIGLTLFRSVPHLVKPLAFNDGNFIDFYRLADRKYNFSDYAQPMHTTFPELHRHGGLDFLLQLQTNLKVTKQGKTFRFYHLLMPHEPFMLNSDLEFGRIGKDYESYIEYSLATIHLLIAYLEQLKISGVYNNSTIIVSSDHGGGEYGSKIYDTKKGEFINAGNAHGRAIASGRALLLVKEPNNYDPLKDSSKPVSLLDVAPTIADSTDISINLPGSSVFSAEEGTNQERQFFYYQFTGTDSKFLADFDVYKINGPTVDPHSWVYVQTLSKQIDYAGTNQPYVLGMRAGYGSDHREGLSFQNQFLVPSLWDESVDRYTKTISSEGAMDILLASPLEDTFYEFKFKSKTTSTIPSDLLVSINKQPPKRVSINDLFVHNTVVFRGEQRKRINISLKLDDKEADSNKINLSDFTISKIDLKEISCGDLVTFREKSNLLSINGISNFENWGSWSDNRIVRISFVATQSECSINSIRFQLKGYVNEKHPIQTATVLLNNSRIGDIAIKTGTNQKNYSFPNVSKFIHKGTINSIEFRIDSPVSPKSLGRSNDQRQLGLGFINMSIQ